MTKIMVLLYSERCKCHSKILQKEKIESDKIGKQGCGTWRKKYTKCAFSALVESEPLHSYDMSVLNNYAALITKWLLLIFINVNKLQLFFLYYCLLFSSTPEFASFWQTFFRMHKYFFCSYYISVSVVERREGYF